MVMKTVLSVLFRSAVPDEEWLIKMMDITGAYGFVYSIPNGSYRDGALNHENPSSKCFGPCMVKWLSSAMAPLVKAACDGEHEAVWFIHDDVVPSNDIARLKDELGDNSFVSVAPVKIGFPPAQAIDYSSRCVLWKRGKMLEYLGEPIQPGVDTRGKTTLELAMEKMDQNGDKYAFSTIQVKTL